MKQSDYSARTPLIIGVIGVLVLVGGFGSWAVGARLAGAVIANGRIEVEQNRQVVQHPEGGVVTKILVQDGDLAAADDILIQLDTSRQLSQLSIIEGQYFEQLARRTRFEAERDSKETLEFDPILLAEAVEDLSVQALMDGQSRLFETRRKTLATQLDQLSKRSKQIAKQIDGYLAQIAALRTQDDLLKIQFENQSKLLEKKLTQASIVSDIERQRSAVLGEIGELDAAKAEAEVRIAETELQALSLTTQRREEAITMLRDLQVSIQDLAEQRRDLLRQIDRMDIRAPVSGAVLGLQVFAERSVIQPAQPLLYLVPRDRPLIIGAQIEPIHVDQVFKGQEATLRFPAFDSQTTPDVKGQVVNVSADAFTDENTGASYYSVQIEIGEGEISALPEDAVLVPGMPVTAFIRTGDRSPMSYLLQPLTDYFDKAFRES